MFISEYLNIDYERMEEIGVFDAFLEKDSAFFINIQRLKQTKELYFQHSYDRIRTFFSEIATILEASEMNDTKDKFYREALKRFDFSEVNELNLGFGNSTKGSGMGIVLRKQIINDAYEIIKKGCKAPELFEMIGLFEEGIGPDRISDMIATIILPDIQAYTRRIMSIFEINSLNYSEDLFDSEGYIINKFKKCRIYFLPVDILHKLPIVECWEDIEIVAEENEAIRKEMNFEVGVEWKNWASKERKLFIRNCIMKDPQAFKRVVKAYKEENVEEYNLYNNLEYFIEKTLQRIKTTVDFSSSKKDEKNSFLGALEAINIFKFWVENNKGWYDVQHAASGEKSVQRFLYGCAQYYIEQNNLAFSCEPNEGLGPTDFKVSRGRDCTVVELKLSSNNDYMHGYQVQIEEYAKAEKTNNMIFVFVDIGNPIRVKKLMNQNAKDIKEGKIVPKVIIIDATTKLSASKK